MTSALSHNFPPGKTMETATRTALAEEEKLRHIINDNKLARKRKLDDTRVSINWLGSARGAAQVVLDSSADVVSVLSSFVDNLSSVISIHESDQIFGDLEQSLPSVDAAKRSWESVADVVENLLVQMESLKSATLSHAECTARELGEHESIEQQSQIFLDSLTQSIDALTRSITQKRTILHPIRRMPTEILEKIFELAALDERSILQRNPKSIDVPPGAIYRELPRVPTILASTCRRWRTIALNMARLWSFLFVPTSRKCISHGSWRRIVVGVSSFQQARSRIGAAECELTVWPSIDWGMVVQHLLSIPASQISTMNIVLPPDQLDFSQFPTPSVLRILKGYSSWEEVPRPPPSVSLPTSFLARTRELSCRNVLPAVVAPILSVTNFSLILEDYFSAIRFPDLGLLLARFPNLTALILNVQPGRSHPQITFTPLHHARVGTLSITGTVIPHLCASLQRGALSLPSLTHFILLDIFASSKNNREEWSQMQSLFVNLTCFEIRAATQQGCGSNIRQLLDVMPLLEQFTVFDSAVNDGLQALLIGPIKRVGKLVVSDSKTDGSDVKSYYNALRSESANRPDDNSEISIQFVDCPCILPQIRQELSS